MKAAGAWRRRHRIIGMRRGVAVMARRTLAATAKSLARKHQPVSSASISYGGNIRWRKLAAA